MACELTSKPAGTNLATAEVEVEDSSCAFGCQSADELLHRFGDYQIYRCQGCGLVRLNPRLSEAQLSSLYARDYFSGEHATGYDSYEQDASYYQRTFARRLRLVKRYGGQGRLLDIGCGLGYSLQVAAREGFDVYGLDLSPYAVEQCEKLFPGRVREGSLTSGLYPRGNFDVVTLSDVFEHVYRPLEFVQALHETIRDNGMALVTTPNHRSVLSRLSGRNWISFKIPEHVYFYTPETLKKLVTPLFTIERLQSDGQYCSLEFLAKRIKTLSRAVGTAMHSSVRAMGLGGLPVFVNSGSMTAVLRKNPLV